MKKNLIIALFGAIISCSAYAQFSAGMQIGFSNKNSVAGIHTQYQFKNKLTVGLNLTAHLDETNPAFLQSRFGYMLGSANGLSVQPYIGYNYTFHSIDKNMPESQFTKGVQFRYLLKRNARIFTDLNIPASGFYVISIGITGML